MPILNGNLHESSFALTSLSFVIFLPFCRDVHFFCFFFFICPLRRWRMKIWSNNEVSMVFSTVFFLHRWVHSVNWVALNNSSLRTLFLLFFVWFWLLFYYLLLFVYVECVFECHCLLPSIAEFNQKAIFETLVCIFALKWCLRKVKEETKKTYISKEIRCWKQVCNFALVCPMRPWNRGKMR